MKKVLFATTALVMTAGVAAAEVAVSGTGRMGMIYDGNDVQFSSRARVIFTLTGESDAGLSFGGKFRADQASGANQGVKGEVWVSGTYGKLAMGDTVSASEAAIGDLTDVGYTDGGFAGDVEEITYLTGDGVNTDQGPNVLYTYTMDQITFFASASDGSTGYKDETSHGAWSLAAKYDAGNWNAGLGYAKQGDAKEISLGGEAKFNNFSVKGIYVKYDDASFFDGLVRAGRASRDNATGAVSWDQLANFSASEFDAIVNGEQKYTVGLGATYQMDAIQVGGFWRQDKAESGDNSAKFNSFGIGASYDLGGGATLAGGIIDTDYLQDTVADVGVKFKF